MDRATHIGHDGPTDVLSASALKKRLLAARNLEDARARSAMPDIVRNTDDWVRVWVDQGNVVQSEYHGARATRAITDGGQLIWMVLKEGRRRAYHATAQSVEEAFGQMQLAGARRRRISRQMPALRRLRRDVLLGRVKLRPTLEDARQSGLCDLGVEGFLTRMRLGQRPDYPGYLLALVSLIDRQVAYPLFIAAERTGQLR